MRIFSAIAALVFFAAIFPFVSFAQEQPTWEVQALNQIIPGSPEGRVDYYPATGTAVGTNIYVKYGDTVMMADNATLNQESGDAIADGHVRIQQGDQIWIGEHIRYNFKTHRMQSEQFRTGKPPVFAQGEMSEGNSTNRVYDARHTLVTSDDVSDPAFYMRSSHVRIVPGKYVEMWNAVMFVKGVPVFYLPYYKRNIGNRANNLNLMPGYRSSYGPYLLMTYVWYWGEDADGQIHLDYREARGPGLGPDVNLHLGRAGELSFKYYYMHDSNPGQTTGTNNLTSFGAIPENRQRFYLSYQSTPLTNLNVKAMVNYQSDPLFLHDFFEGDYRENPQPPTFVEVNKYWNNWSLDAEATPRILNFFDQVERLPDVKLTGFRQQVFNTPVYYESESSIGYFRKVFADTNGLAPNINANFSAARADTFHQLLVPYTFLGVLNVTPRVGGRFTYYSDDGGPGGTHGETYRTVFNTGVDTSFKVSRLWPDVKSSLLDVDGLRHIMEPSVSYIFVPNPSTPPPQLPQFDSELPGLTIPPIQFPDYNNIDSIDSQNVMRFGLRNTLQTKRDGQVENLFDWKLSLDWRIKPNTHNDLAFNFDSTSLGPQKTFNDLYSDLAFRPRSWITLESQVRYDINDGQVNLAFHQIAFTPNEWWSWGVGHWYLRNGFLGGGNNLFTSTMFFRVNDNWAFRATHYFNAQTGRLQEQFYSIYRDFRSWTGALTFRVVDNGGGPTDFTVAFAFSLKAAPLYPVGGDAVKPYQLIGE
jgi:LPS-assembly protein